MDYETIKQVLDDELKDMPWSYKYWKRENTIEFRNTGEHLSKDEVKNLMYDYLEDLEGEGAFQVLLKGKLGVMKKDEDFWLYGVDREGKPGEKEEKLDKEEVKELFKKSIKRIDSGTLPTNRAVIHIDEILDIYSEEVNEDKFVMVNMRGKKSIALRSDGGLQFRT